MTAILGVSAYYHDAAAALVVDGRIVAAAQEERFTRKKHDASFPQNAVAFCLAEGGLSAADLDYVAYYEKPLTKFERLLKTYIGVAPRGYGSFRRAMPVWIKQKLHLRRELREGLGEGYRGRLVFTAHHESHAASAFFPSPFDEAAILTLDGVGEWSTATRGVGRGNHIDLTHELRFPHSLGLLYSAFTYYTGFRVNSGEYKVMGLAPYGKPVYHDLILEHLLDLKEDGSFRMDQRFFSYCHGLTMTSPAFHELFGGPPRKPEDELAQRHMDLAASVQSVTEEIVLRIARAQHAETGLPNLVLAGGVALNCVANGRLLRETPFDQIWIQPASGDAGGALGAALFVWHQLLERPRTPGGHDAQRGSLLGSSYTDDEILATLTQCGAVHTTYGSDEALCDAVSKLLADSNVVGWFQGRMEFGPRALGARSILADPRSTDMQSVLNLKIKFRESFRPFAPIVLKEHVHLWFGMREGEDSPYMTLVAPVDERRRVAPAEAAAPATGLQLLQQRRSDIPAVTHVDHSARVQTVDSERNPLLHQLMTVFHERTECPVLVNTSFNVRGEPIVCTPQQALDCFLVTDMDVLVLGHHVLLKKEQPAVTDTRRREHLARFDLD